MSRPDDAGFRGWRIETFEDRLALSAQPIADFWYDTSLDAIAEPSSALVQPLATSDGRGWTDLATAREQYGLRGGGQTVAIIDSGIAYDHVALGGGLGSSYKVVGGWDFAENDANPYDDAPAGFHGTHVAGIVGSQDSRYVGVAPNVDLVALRVFDDQGSGYFNWVDSALKWVHQNRNTFEFPITTVNLSLGTEWNANTLPQWASLEASLKQLADDGIFISVAAGNSFQTYNAVGVSYPAVSPNVTAVASVDANGNLSRFSQRNQDVLAAPGERVMSTLPDAFYGGDGNKNDWGAASGTSMAAPYVAGASVLVREAMQDLGYTQITQASIEELFHRTADKVFDAITNATYDRINVGRALSTLVGTDDFGSTVGTASSVGQLSTKLQVSGTIGTTTDQDFFQFTAMRSGQATLTLTGSQELGAKWQAAAGGQIAGSKLTLNVVAGQTYIVGVGGGGASIGKFAVELQLNGNSTPAPTFNPVNWGTIDQRQIDNIAVSGGEAWFQVTASRAGRFTAEAFFANARGNIDLELYDSQQRLLSSSNGAGGSERMDVNAAAGDTFFLRVRGNNSEVDFRLTNLVSIVGNAATVNGTTATDVIQWQAGGQLTVNGVNYSLAGITQVTLNGGGGSDVLMLAGGAGAESVVLRAGSAEVTSATSKLTASSFETIQYSGDAADRVTFYDSAGADVFEARPQFARMTGGGFSNSASGVQNVAAFSTSGGADTARLYDSAANDTLTATPTSAKIVGGVYSAQASGFGEVIIAATAGGYDTAVLYDSAAIDYLDVSAAYAWQRGGNYSIRAEGFEYIAAIATYGGGDRLNLIGSTGDDALGIYLNTRNLFSGGVQIYTYNFQSAMFDGGGGYDHVEYYAVAKNPSLYGRGAYGRILDQLFETQFSGVESLVAQTRSSQKLKADLAALDYAFQKFTRS
jgi:subtilisin family serine protease